MAADPDGIFVDLAEEDLAQDDTLAAVGAVGGAAVARRELDILRPHDEDDAGPRRRRLLEPAFEIADLGLDAGKGLAGGGGGEIAADEVAAANEIGHELRIGPVI